MPTRSPREAGTRTAIVGLAALASGLGSYVLLIVVSRSTSELAYSEFAVFWSLTVTIGLGIFYPVEQETAREVSGRPDARTGGLTRFVLVAAGTLAVAAATLSLLLFTPPGLAYIGLPGLVIALIASFVAYALQFPLRGLLSGSGLTTSYSGVIATEGVLRVVLPLALALLGVTNPVVFAFVVAVAAAIAVVPALLGRDRSWLRHSLPSRAVYASQAGRLIVAALSIQLLLNSSTLLAKAVADGQDGALAGQILTCLSIARIPIFVYQVAQILYLPRLAAEWATGELPAVRRTLSIALAAAGVVGVLITGGMAVLGAWVTSLLFGADLVLSLQGTVLVSLGVSVFLVAVVASDGAIALRAHTLVLRSWVVAVICAVPVAVFVDDILLRVTGPFILGALVAFVQLITGVLRRYRHRLRDLEGSAR